MPQRRQALERLVLHATSLRIPIVELEGGSLTALAGFDGHQGIGLVVAPRRWATIEDILARAVERGEPPFVLVLDSLEDPQNVGTLLRSAEAAGVHGVLFPTHRQAPLTPSAVKASAGATEHLLLCPVDDLPGGLADLHVRGLRVAGAEADAPLTVRQTDLRGPLALVVGSEGQGLGPAVRRRCDLFMRIPMRGAIGSLNAAVAGSILLFEALAQRDPEGRSTPPAPFDAPRAPEPDELVPPDPGPAVDRIVAEIAADPTPAATPKRATRAATAAKPKRTAKRTKPEKTVEPTPTAEVIEVAPTPKTPKATKARKPAKSEKPVKTGKALTSATAGRPASTATTAKAAKPAKPVTTAKAAKPAKPVDARQARQAGEGRLEAVDRGGVHRIARGDPDDGHEAGQDDHAQRGRHDRQGRADVRRRPASRRARGQAVRSSDAQGSQAPHAARLTGPHGRPYHSPAPEAGHLR